MKIVNKAHYIHGMRFDEIINGLYIASNKNNILYFTQPQEEFSYVISQVLEKTGYYNTCKSHLLTTSLIQGPNSNSISK